MNATTLSSARQRLVRLMQQIHFGCIENLRVTHGDPLWHPPPGVTRDVVIGRQGSPHRPTSDDFALKQKVINLFALFDDRQELDVARLEVQDGLPFRIAIRETAGA